MAEIATGKCVDAIDLEPRHRKMVNSVLARNVPFKLVWAYGSRVKWNANERSDLDCVVFGASEDEIYQTREAFAQSDIPFEVQVFSWEELPEDFHHNILSAYYVLRTEGDWGERLLHSITDKIGSGATPKGGSNAYQDEGISLMRSQNVLDFTFSPEGLAYINDDQPDKLKNVIVNENDVLLNITGDSVARCCIVNGQYLPARVNQHVAIIRVSPKDADHRFVFYHLQHTKPDLLSQSEIGATRRALTKGIIENLIIPYPHFCEQKAIAEVLASLDDKIDLLHRQNQTLESLAETLFKQWFIVEASDDWEPACLPDEFNFTMGLSPPGSSYNEDGEGMPMFQGNADFTFRFPDNRIYTTEPKRVAHRFDTLISVRAPVGEQNMAGGDCCIGRGLAAFRYKRNPAYYTYTYYKLKSLMDEIKQFNETGTVFGSISKKDFEAFSITLPPSTLVDDYELEVKPINDKLIQNCAHIRTLETLRDTLLPKLMSGAVRVQYDPTSSEEAA